MLVFFSNPNALLRLSIKYKFLEDCVTTSELALPFVQITRCSLYVSLSTVRKKGNTLVQGKTKDLCTFCECMSRN